jgi:hypothetical protein
MKNLLTILLLTFLFTQEPILNEEVGEPCPDCPTCEVCPPECEGTCLSEEETQGLFNNIKELEFKRQTCETAYSNLESQMQEYDEYIDDCDEQAKLYEEQIKIKEDMIKTIKPKWYHNRYLWFFGGVFFTSSTVYLAGQLD